MLVTNLKRIVVERRQCANDATHDGHRVRVASEALEKCGDLIVNHGVVFDGVYEVFALLLSG